ncbi:hypothetical protein LOD99_6485 [Oopsacas minuta]|uniref:UBC core domain-containing protein n=1 Tax=Oopsacas minuta TaxID=111878 RepID=A0AAV7JLC2_9METZ|nr:hypothetical protein LOD99_6485 [Oopsacas minuta]
MGCSLDTSKVSLNRLKKELTYMMANPMEMETAEPRGDENNEMYTWVATIKGPKDSPYEGGMFYVNLNFPASYPVLPPKIEFITPIYHPNIAKEGEVSVNNILPSGWGSTVTIPVLLTAISSLLANPNPDDPILADMGRLYREDRQLYDETAREMTLKHAV